MNDDPPPSSAAPNVGRPADAQAATDETMQRRNDSASRSPSQSRRRRKKKGKKKRNPGLKKKLGFVTHMLKSLDLLVFAELSAMYYMECSMFRFLLRCAGQYIYLSPKDETFPFLMPASRMHVLLVVIPNIICMFLHLFTALPVGSEYHRGYQHGGLIIDFIGQKPSRSRIYYLLADLFIMALQCFMLTVHTERERLRIALKTFRPALPELVQQFTNGRTIEDLDAEERGIAREQSDLAVNENEDVEMQPLNPNGEAAGDAEANSREASGDEEPRTHLSDIMNSGNAVLGDYHILHTLRRAAIDLERTAAHSLRTIGYSTTMAAITARRRGQQVGAAARPNV